MIYNKSKVNRKLIILSAVSLLSQGLSAQNIEASSDVVDCGQVEYRLPVTAEFELKNTGNNKVRITKVETACGCVVAEYPTNDIPSDDKFVVRVTYDAMQMGRFNKFVDVYCTGNEEPLILTMKGLVVRDVVDFSGNYPFKIGMISADKNNIEFDDVYAGERPQQSVHIRNTSGETVQPVIMHLPDYLKAEVSPSKIAPGRSGVITFTLVSKELKYLGLTQTKVYLGKKPGDKVSGNKEISVSAVLLPTFNNMTEQERALAPVIRLSQEKLDLGAFDGKKKLKGDITIRNEGKSDLRINNLQMFTAGLSLSLNKTVIPPGQEAKLKVTADAKQLKTVRSEPRILIITNDPQKPKIAVNILISDR